MREKLITNELWDMVRQTSINMEAVLKPLVESFDLTMLQCRILIAIDEMEKSNVGNVCKLLEISNGNASNMCKRLEKEGFIERNRSNIDERVVELFLTDKGKEAKDKIFDELINKFKPILDRRSDEDFEIILLGMKKLNELLNELLKEQKL